MIEALVDAEIPVMGHLGLTPQSVHAMGGFKVQAKSSLDAAMQLVADAKALEHAGCFALVLEGVPSEVAAMVTEAVDVPTIGIGAGPTATARCSCTTTCSASRTAWPPSSCAATPT
jgi:3-methyl-2-oxobutanoate hydroxymethyltransferase